MAGMHPWYEMPHWYDYPILAIAMAVGVYLRVKGQRLRQQDHKAGIDDDK